MYKIGEKEEIVVPPEFYNILEALSHREYFDPGVERYVYLPDEIAESKLVPESREHYDRLMLWLRVTVKAASATFYRKKGSKLWLIAVPVDHLEKLKGGGSEG